MAQRRIHRNINTSIQDGLAVENQSRTKDRSRTEKKFEEEENHHSYQDGTSKWEQHPL